MNIKEKPEHQDSEHSKKEPLVTKEAEECVAYQLTNLGLEKNSIIDSISIVYLLNNYLLTSATLTGDTSAEPPQLKIKYSNNPNPVISNNYLAALTISATPEISYKYASLISSLTNKNLHQALKTYDKNFLVPTKLCVKKTDNYDYINLSVLKNTSNVNIYYLSTTDEIHKTSFILQEGDDSSLSSNNNQSILPTNINELKFNTIKLVISYKDDNSSSTNSDINAINNIISSISNKLENNSFYDIIEELSKFYIDGAYISEIDLVDVNICKLDIKIYGNPQYNNQQCTFSTSPQHSFNISQQDEFALSAFSHDLSSLLYIAPADSTNPEYEDDIFLRYNGNLLFTLDNQIPSNNITNQTIYTFLNTDTSGEQPTYSSYTIDTPDGIVKNNVDDAQNVNYLLTSGKCAFNQAETPELALDAYTINRQLYTYDNNSSYNLDFVDRTQELKIYPIPRIINVIFHKPILNIDNSSASSETITFNEDTDKTQSSFCILSNKLIPIQTITSSGRHNIDLTSHATAMAETNIDWLRYSVHWATQQVEYDNGTYELPADAISVDNANLSQFSNIINNIGYYTNTNYPKSGIDLYLIPDRLNFTVNLSGKNRKTTSNDGWLFNKITKPIQSAKQLVKRENSNSPDISNIAPANNNQPQQWASLSDLSNFKLHGLAPAKGVVFNYTTNPVVKDFADTNAFNLINIAQTPGTEISAELYYEKTALSSSIFNPAVVPEFDSTKQFELSQHVLNTNPTPEWKYDLNNSVTIYNKNSTIAYISSTALSSIDVDSDLDNVDVDTLCIYTQLFGLAPYLNALNQFNAANPNNNFNINDILSISCEYSFLLDNNIIYSYETNNSESLNMQGSSGYIKTSIPNAVVEDAFKDIDITKLNISANITINVNHLDTLLEYIEEDSMPSLSAQFDAIPTISIF